MTEIRPAGPDDIAAIARVHIASWQAAYRGVIADPMLDHLDIAKHAIGWQRALDQEVPILVAEADGEVVGFASRRENEITVLYLAPTHWRRGIGRALLARCLLDIGAEGHERAWLWVLEANRVARAFYAAQGGVESDRETVGVGGQSLVQVRYVWRLRETG